MNHKEASELGLKWIKDGFITSSLDNNNSLYELSKRNKYSLLKVIFKEPEFSTE